MRPVRSYVLRQGRITVAQQKALEELWPEYGIVDDAGHIDQALLFGRDAPLVLEIGFGDGEATWRMARDEPEKNFIGVEVHLPGVGHLLRRLAAHDIGNVRIAQADAVEFISDRIDDFCLAGVRIWFPDPWPKKRHHKRRLIQPEFIRALGNAIKPGGVLHMATDWEHYAEQMREVADASTQFDNLAGSGCYSPDRADRPETKFERRGLRLGHEVRDLLYRRRAG